MRSQYHNTQQFGEEIKKKEWNVGKSIDFELCGLKGRQWLSCVLICLMLGSVFGLPVRAVSVSRGAGGGEAFEPVNERLPMWTDIWRNLNARFEAWTTTKRPENTFFDLGDDDDKKKKKEKKGKRIDNPAEKNETKSNSDKSSAENPDSKTTTKSAPTTEGSEKAAGSLKSEIASKPILPDKIKNTSASTVRMISQLPEDERNSVYNYQNNLGNPPGQVEKDSSNQAAALPIRHRAGVANFNFGVLLASLSGRGLDVGVGLTYNSRTWNKSLAVDPNNSNSTIDHYTYDVEQSWIAPGFSSGFGYLETAATVQYIHPLQSSNFQYFTEIVPLGNTDPDGTRHQFLCSSWTSIPNSYSQKCNSYSSTDGTFISIASNGWTGNPLNSQSPNTSGYQNSSFIAKFPNGTKVWYSGGFGSGTARRHYPVRIEDSNGNYFKIYYKSDQSGRIDYIRDTLNRDIKFYYENDTNGNPDKLAAVTIPGMGANEEIQTVRFYYQTMNLNSAGKFNGQITAPATIRVLRYIYLPATKTGYKFDYHSNYGMINRISSLTGVLVADLTNLAATGTVTGDGLIAATTEYDYPDGSTALNDVPKYTKRTDDWQGRTDSSPSETFYDVPEPGSGDYISRTTVKDNGFDVVTETVSSNTSNWQSGLIKETSVRKIYGSNGQFSELMSKTVFIWTQGSGGALGRQNPKLQKIETTNEAGLTKATEFECDQYNNQTKVKEYDYAPPGTLGTLLRTTEIEYETGAGWINAGFLGLAKSVKTIVGGVTVSKTLYEYDHNGNDSTLTKYSDLVNHDPAYNPLNPPRSCETCCDDPDHPDSCAENLPPGYTIEDNGEHTPESHCHTICTGSYNPETKYRGNVTKIERLIDTGVTQIGVDSNANVTNYNYDIAGNPVSETLSCCQLKTVTYNKSTEYAFPVSEIKGSFPTQLTASATYNLNTGLMLTSTDENNQITSYEYETDTLRSKKTTYPNGGYVLTEYSDKLVTSANDLLPSFVRTTTTLDSGHTTQSYSYFNGRGREIRSAKLTPDGWSISAVEFDKLGRTLKASNPFYASTPTGDIPSGTKFTQVLNYDALGRITQVQLQDFTIVSTEFGNQNSLPGGFSKNFVIITDQAGRKRRQVADALGRIVRVDEPDTSDDLGTVDNPKQPTYYEYDGNDNLSKVTQSDGTVTQERLFKYDSLSRLTHEKQVEATPTLDNNGTKQTSGGLWTKVLKYNTDGFLVDGYNARGANTHFSYDGLNRISTITFSDGTPTITYTYDQARTGYFNKGTLTKVETADGGAARADTPSTAAEFDFDKMGRLVQHRQKIGQQVYALEYTYNLAGQLTSEKYPSGKIVSTNYDSNGRILSVGDQARVYANSLQYQQFGGALSSISFGNGTKQTFTLNERLQMTNQTLSKESEIIQKYDYVYGELDSNNVLKNNGKLERVVSYIGAQKQWTQKFTYDSIGRLSEAKEYRGDTNALSYRQKFDYDRFGNLFRKTASNPTAGQENPLPYTPIEEADINKATNHLTLGTIYDESGDVTQDTKFRDQNFWYDANGRMYKTSNTANTSQSSSVYNSAGQRVATLVDNIWTYLIYDAFGNLVAEYGGLQAADEGGVKYLLQDWQGSSRAILSNTGVVQGRMDYTAFGEEIQAGIGQRTTSQGFGTNNNLNRKYALTERDKATGLDHTWFRKLENQAGRWTSPDQYNGSASIGDPQSFNRYSYVVNEPTNNVDPSGLLLVPVRCWCVDGSVPGWTDPNPSCEICWIEVNYSDPRMGNNEFLLLLGPLGVHPGDPVLPKTCGVNPITGRPGIRDDRPNPQTGLRTGGLGNIRPGNGGGGAFGDSRSNKPHAGTDLVAPIGTPVLASMGGTVVKVISGFKPANTAAARAAQNGGLGNAVTILNDAGIYDYYGHLTNVLVVAGERVEQGQNIGTAGRTGNANNSHQPPQDDHVHFGRFTGPMNSNGRPVNRNQWLDPVRSVNSPCP